MAYNLKSVKLSRYLLLKEMDFTFRPGISLVGGENRVGKSLAFSGIVPMLYRECDYKHPSGSNFQLDFSKSVGDTLTEFSLRSKTTKSSKLSMFIDGEDQTPHTIKDARGLISESWAIPYDLFYSTVFLQGTRTHPLATGTPAKRSEWLSNVLDIVSVYDGYSDKVSDLLSNCKTGKTKLQVLEEQLDQLPKAQTSITKQARGEAGRQISELTKEGKKLPQKIEMLATRLRHLTLANQLPKKPNTSKTLEELSDQRYSLTKKIAKLEVQLEQSDKQTELRRRLEAGAVKFGDLTLDDIKIKHTTLDGAENQLNVYKDKIKPYLDQKELREARSNWEKTGYKPKHPNLKSAIVAREKCQGVLSSSKDRLLKLKSISGEPECSTCGAKLNNSQTKSQLAKTKMRIKKVRDNLQELRDEIIYWEAMNINLISKPGKPSMTKELIEKRRAWLREADKWLMLKDSSGLSSKIISVASLKDRLTKLRTQLVRVKKLHKASQAYSEAIGSIPKEILNLSPTHTVKQLDKTSKLLKLKKDRLQKITKDILHYRGVLDRYREQVNLSKIMKTQREGLVKQINELKKLTRDLPSLVGLQQAFGSTGLRLLQLQESAKIFESKLTELSTLFFDEPYTFRVNVAPRKLDIMIERNGIEGNLSTLSGSESGVWSLLCAMALLHILPNRLRCDTIILDEVEAMLSKKSRDRYTMEVLPELKVLIPNIVVITPLISGELKLVPEHNYRVVKTYKRGTFSSELREE